MVYRFAVLSTHARILSDNRVSHYLTFTLSSHQQALQLAYQLNAVVCGWRAQG